MRWIGVVVCCLVLTGGNAQDLRTANVGEETTFNVFDHEYTVASCHLTTPTEETYDFFHDQPSENGDRYVLLPANSMPACSITVKNIMESDSGIWTVTLKNSAGAENSQSYNLFVHPEVSEDVQNVKWLNDIEFPTRIGQNVDVSLSSSAYTEDCYIRKPDESHFTAAGVNINGVTVHGSSDFVSCRITVGPMDNTLFGEWVLCGRRTDNSAEPERCQRMEISLDSRWSSVNPERSHQVVSYGATLTPVVHGLGTRVTCHIITPGNEDLVIAADSEYPYLSLAPTVTSACSIAIGPIQESMIGNWTLYGRFEDSFGIQEVFLPMTLVLYDENNPHDQAYNVTVRDPVKRAVNLGTTLNIEVSGSGKVDNCEVMTPSGETFDLDRPDYEGASFVSVGETTTCRIAIGPITKQLLGNWTIIGKFSNNGHFTEEQQTFEVLEEDPANPIIDDGRVVENMTAQRVTADIGTSQRLLIHSSEFITGESCHILTPAGLQYAIMDGFNVPGVEIVEEHDVECGVIVHVLSEEAVGTWTLIARAKRTSSQLIERRLSFTIDVEETVEALPKEVTIYEGNDLYVRLVSRTEQYESCRLVAPTGNVSSHVVDPLHIQSCGYIINNISSADAGTWEIIYGSRATYTARIVVSVTEVSNADTETTSSISLIRDRSVNMTVGPEGAVYCRLHDPQGITVFDGFGRCTLALDRVDTSHHGAWRMVVAMAGKVVGVEHQLYAYVREAETKPLVATHVAQDKPLVTVTCSIATDANVNACKFRDPQGKLLLAAGGVAEDRYVFHGAETSYESSVRTHECGLQITNPLVTDLGIWRCAIDTDEDTYYGFLDVLCPWALQNDTIAATVQQVPILRATTHFVDGVEEKPVTLSCTVEAAIRYCYFRASNGTTFTVSPGMSSHNMEYVGAGFEAGDCGVKFHSMSRTDSGNWGCHVGLVRDHEEQRDSIALNIEEAMRVEHYHNYNSHMFVEGVVYMDRIDYCRYVRIDGFGFTTDRMPTGYLNSGRMEYGQCQLTIVNPTILDMHPWTVVAKIQGQDAEISRDTMDSILIGGPSDHEQNEIGVASSGGPSATAIFLYVFMAVIFVAVLLSAWLGPKKNREWTASRASLLRRSIQRSFRKEPLPPAAPINQNV